MSKGYVAIHRKTWESPHFRDEPFSEREAWFWMIAQACWRRKTIRGIGSTITLERGQFCHSIRFLAKRWKWTAAKTQRFLGRLKTDTLIDTANDRGSVTQIYPGIGEFLQRIAIAFKIHGDTLGAADQRPGIKQLYPGTGCRQDSFLRRHEGTGY